MEQLISSGEVGRLISLMPVGLKEAALDSPTARASVQHCYEQVELIEKWLDDYLKSTNRLLAESTTLENILTNFTSHASLPQAISETMIDHDYSLLAVKKYHEGARDFWMSMVAVVKTMPILVCEPIRQFQTNDIKTFKDARRVLDQTQKNHDTLHSKFAALHKSTEPSSLREDAFQLHEARRLYLKAMMDYFSLVPQFRFSLDKLVVKIFYGQWKEMRQSRDTTASTFQRTAQEMERVKGWTREMEDSERTFKKELLAARKQLEESAELASRPSRDTEGYSNFTVSHGLAPASTSNGLGSSPERREQSTGEKQGWLFLRTYVRKPTRVIWVKKWAFVRNGVFGWLIQGAKSGTVEESERIGVLLCSVRPLPAEERRFCFELKTNKNTIGLQAETQPELASWIAAIETAKANAVNDPASSEALTPGLSQADPAFAITAAPVPEFGTSILASTDPITAADDTSVVDKSNALGILSEPGKEGSELLRRATAIAGPAVEDAAREHASRIMSKLDLHRKAASAATMSPGSPNPSGGIASLIAASHGSMPVGPSIPMIQHDHSPLIKKSNFTLALRDMPPSSLAPSTLITIPAPTSLSKPAVSIAGERGIYGSRTNKNGIPNGILANTWGSVNGSYIHRLERSELRPATDGAQRSSPLILPIDPVLSNDAGRSVTTMDLAIPAAAHGSRTPSPNKGRRQTFSIDRDVVKPSAKGLPGFPPNYPLQLKTQDAQFRLLFPNVHHHERLVLVFRCTWNPNDQQEFPGRVYVTPKEIYFYSNHFGMVLTSAISLPSIDEVTAAPGKDCDFLYIHLREASATGATRVTIKVFLEPLKLLQNRLNFLVLNSLEEEPFGLENVIRKLLKMEHESDRRSPSVDSMDEFTSAPSGAQRCRSRANTFDLKAPVRADKSLSSNLSGPGEKQMKFVLPAQPVRYVPPGYSHLAVEREYDVSPKALFHVMFGDKSLLWQLLQHERQAQNSRQGPWTALGEGRLYRDFQFSIPITNVFGQSISAAVKDFQLIDVNNDHLCYAVTDKKTPWHLPNRDKYRLISKIVITHVAKSRCKLAVYTKVEWLSDPWYLKQAIDRHAIQDLDTDAQDLADIVTDQVRRLGAYSRTRKATQIFGQVGQSTEVLEMQVEASAISLDKKRMPTRRTMTSMLLEDAASMGESAVSTVLQAVIEFARWLGKTCNAHSVILLVLAFSVLYNTWFVTRTSLSWWHERHNIQFLQKLGVGPNHVMSKAIYVDDMHNLMTQRGSLPMVNVSACYNGFISDHGLDDPNSPLPFPNGQVNEYIDKRRYHDARQRLGMYRHDLLVAMRVVNSIEQEMLKGAWENWVVSEHHHCGSIEPVVAAVVSGSKVAALDKKDVEAWYEKYCGSCNDEYDKLMAADRSLDSLL